MSNKLYEEKEEVKIEPEEFFRLELIGNIFHLAEIKILLSPISVQKK